MITNMKQENKELLLKDLCARLPYEVKVKIKSYDKPVTLQCITNNNSSYFKIEEIGYDFRTWEEDIKPYLRPMSSMTKEERKEYERFSHFSIGFAPILMDWIYSHHLDCCGLIEKGLALEAPKDMYKF